MKTVTCSILSVFIIYFTAAAQPMPMAHQAVIDSLTYALNSYYVYPDKAAFMSQRLQAQQRAGRYDSIHNQAGFADQLNKDISAIHNDKHLSIRYDPALQKKINLFNTSKLADPADQQRAQRQNFFFKKLEILPCNIGYLAFTSFADTSAAARQTVRAAMQFLANTDALIIDLRHNYGGNGTMAGENAGYFFSEKTVAGRSYNRLTDRWTDQWLQNDPLITQGLTMNMPVYVLTSKRTFSAAEGLAYNLQQLKKAIVVGDTSRGGAHLTRSFSIGNGYVAFIPFTRLENTITHTDWEGSGVTPNVYASENNSLTTAQQLILQQLLASTTNDNEQRKIHWQLNYLRSLRTTHAPSKATSQLQAGRFEEFEFILRNNQFIAINHHQANKTDTLTPMGPDLYQVNPDMQVAFIPNGKGQYDSIKLYWNDGWTDTISRTTTKTSVRK